MNEGLKIALYAFGIYKVGQFVGFLPTVDELRYKKFLKSKELTPEYYKEKLSSLDKYGQFFALRLWRNEKGETALNETSLNTILTGDVIESTTKFQSIYTKAAREIYNAKGYVSDAEKRAVEAFQKYIGSKVELSMLAQYFEKEYKRNFSEYLNSFLEYKDGSTLLKWYDKLPVILDQKKTPEFKIFESKFPEQAKLYSKLV